MATPNQALYDAPNQAFLELISADDMYCIGDVAVNSGHIEIGDSGKVQMQVSTTLGDGLYQVWKGKKYLVIQIDMLNQMQLIEAVEEEDD